jgi:DNA-binding PadR family transcriptional regulator
MPPGGGDPRFHFGDVFWSLFGRGQRARRGDVRAGILALLSERPYNGYQIIQELEQRSQGVWRPSPGSVYPTFQQLEDEGLVSVDTTGSGRVFSLTEQGKAFVKEHRKELSAPWEAVGRAAGGQGAHRQFHVLMAGLRQVWTAAAQVARAGNSAQVAQAEGVLSVARRALYRILAEDEPEDV